MTDKETIQIYTDGSAINNGSECAACGWAFKIIYIDKEVTKSGFAIGRTNNQMEMLAVLNALRYIGNTDKRIELYSDSKYVIETLKGHYKVKKNKKLWDKVLHERRRFRDIDFYWVQGHGDNPHNAEVDRMAVAESKRVIHTARSFADLFRTMEV